ncbi:MAG: Ig-like domain-containing protein [Muribaculaceae bacterium]
MKHFLITLCAVALSLSAWAQTASFDFTQDNPYGWDELAKDDNGYIDDSEKPFSILQEPVTLSLNGKFRRLAQKAFGGISCLLVYKDATITISCADGYKLTEIDFFSGTGKIANLYVSEGDVTLGDEFETGEVYNHSETGNVLMQTCRSITCSAAGPIVVTDQTGTQVISRIEVKYEAAALKEAGLKWSDTQYTAVIDAENLFPSLSADTDAAITYASSDENVATIDAASGEISLVAAGQTTITASCEANATFDAGSASYLLTVKPAGEMMATYDFTAITSNDDGTGYMTYFSDVPLSTWWTTNPNDEGSYDAGSHFCPLTIGCDGTSLTFNWDGTTGHGNVRATTSAGYNNLQLGGGATMTFALADPVKYSISSVVLNINPGNASSKWDTTVGKMVTNEAGILASDQTANTVTWTPASAPADAFIDCVGGAYIVSVVVNYHATVATGVNSVDSVNNATIEYFNLQGIKIAKPENGVVIVRQGNKTTKQIVR